MSNAHAMTASASVETATGVPNGKLGMWVFLASEVMFFTGLIGAYTVLRMSNPAWPGSDGHLNVWIGTCNTLILICSSTTIVLALAASQRGQTPALRRWLMPRLVRDLRYHEAIHESRVKIVDPDHLAKCRE